MIRTTQKFLLPLLQRMEYGFTLVFGERANPWLQLGAMSFYFFWIVVATGIYLFVFFDTSIVGAWTSVERLSVEQWYLGGVMRSLHRYASDAMAITVTLHLLRELVMGRFRGAHWFSWFSGIPLLWLLFASAIGGYWLVWDEFAQYIAIVTTEWMERLPNISDSLARTFLSDLTLSDRLFSLMVFMHIAIPLFLLIGMFIHIKRLKLARTDPPRSLAIGTMLALVVLSLLKPALSMAPADLSRTVAVVNLDWIYLNVYPLIEQWGPGQVWLLLVGISSFLAALPWLSPAPAQQSVAATVDPANCNGCSWCFQDCPYDAITMITHEYKKGHRQAQVDPDLCTACGICAGACPSATPFRHVEQLVSGIEIPGFPIEQLRVETMKKIARLDGAEARVVLFGCDHALALESLQQPGVAVVSLPCIGLLPPSFVDFIARRDNVDGVLVSGCHPDDCFYRKGSQWTTERFNGTRMPHLRTSAGHDKVKLCWAGALQHDLLEQELGAFRRALHRRPLATEAIAEGAHE